MTENAAGGFFQQPDKEELWVATATGLPSNGIKLL